MANMIAISMSDPMALATHRNLKTITRRIAIGDKCRYAIGDTLYVKETHYIMGSWVKTNQKTKTGRIKYRFCRTIEGNHPIGYADAIPFAVLPNYCNGKRNEAVGYYKRLARFMPKEYARTFLEVLNVRKERLQDISQEDAKKEGIEYPAPHRPSSTDCTKHADNSLFRDCYKCAFKVLWTKIHGKEGNGWDKNPLVWVIQFKRIEKPE